MLDFTSTIVKIGDERVKESANTTGSQKHSAGLTAMTERTLGAKAGHLELLKGGKKNKDTKEGEVKKGGSKKFG